MATQNYFLLAIVMSFTCVRCKTKCPDWVLIELPVHVSPTRDTFLVGDTIEFSFSFQDRIPDKHTGLEVNFEDYEFRIQFAVGKVDTINPVPNTFQYIEPVYFSNGSVTIVDDEYEVTPKYENGVYEFAGYFRLKKPGLFVFAFYHGTKKFTAVSECGNVHVTLRKRMNDGADNNFELLQNSPEPAYKNMSKAYFDEYGTYCFYVQ